jgi:hypothetical protein
MANITLTVPDEVYRAARIRAAEQDTSVSALVAKYLCSLSEREAEFARLEAQRKRIIEGISGFRASDRLSRDAVHERDVH